MNRRQPPDIEDLLEAGLPLWAAFQLWGEMVSLSASPDPLLFEKMIADRVERLQSPRRLQ